MFFTAMKHDRVGWGELQSQYDNTSFDDTQTKELLGPCSNCENRRAWFCLKSESEVLHCDE